MKSRLRNNFFILIFSVISISVNAQNNTNKKTKDLLMGSWTFDLEASKPNMEIKIKTMIEKNQASYSRLEKDYKGRQLIFSTDGRFILHLADGRQTQGNWEVYKANGLESIQLTSLQNHVQDLSIQMLSNQSLVVKQEYNGKGTPVFSKWYFTKN